ncbi:MAG TPA: carboxypeptidase regulatory-like domain-containing protein [Terriglobia bacterium]|nr:carboxypeptidase regulatory-like domain-containing protein [Terriglobia bacterium]
MVLPPHGRTRLKAVAVVLLLVGIFSAEAQTTFGTITGTVTDASGAMIAAADVSVINETTGTRRRVTTGNTGVYVVANLDLGVYTVFVEKAGFRSYKRTGMHLAANQVINVDAMLAVSPIATTVEVTGAVGAEVNTQTATLNNVMPSSQLKQLPVITRQKGDQGLWGYASYNNGIGHEPFFIANGSRYADTQPTVDGITVMSYENAVGGSTVTTGMEATTELSVQLAAAPAEFSRPVQMTMVSKSGANEFHGSVFEDYNGSSLNARDFFSKTVPFRVYNNFGASLGGPITKNKTFFFGAYEGSREATEVINTMNVPPAAWRDGDFSGLSRQLVNPYIGATFAGNRIPAAMISPVSQKLAAIYFPYPNYGPPTQEAGNFRNMPRPGINGVTIFDKVDARIDHNFSVRDTLFGRFSYSRMPLNAYVKNAIPPLGRRASLRTASSAAISWTHTFTPDLLNELRAGYTRDHNFIESGIMGSELLQQVGLQGITVSGIPTYPIVSVSGLSAAGQVPNFLGSGTNFELTENFSWVRGSHSLKFGFDVIRDRNAGFYYGGDVYGQYSFNGAFTGAPYADFLLGVPIKVYNSFPNPANHMFGSWWSAYAQDQFKLTRQLTLTYGMRWEAQGPYYDNRGLIANFNPNPGAWVIPDEAVKYINPAYSSNIPVETASQAAYPARTLLESHHAYFYPRFGVAYRPWADKSTVIRGGYGIYANTIYGSLGATMETGPYSGSQSRTNSFSNGKPAFSFPNPFLAPGVNTPVHAASGIDPHVRVPYLQQWNLAVEQEAAKFIFTASYVGSHAVNLLYSVNLNQARAGTQPFSVSRLPYPNYSDVIWARNGATEHYNALQLAARRTYGKTLFVNAGYTWARDLTNAQDQTSAVGVRPQDSYNLAAEYGPNSFVRAHRFFTNLVYALPLGRGQRFLNHAPQPADLLLDGWRMAWNVMAESGQYYTPSFDSTDPSNTNTFGGRPDRIGNIFVVPGCPAGDPLCSNPVNVGRFGNCGVNVLEGPKFVDADLSVMKDFPLTERMQLQFRTTMTNVFNHPNFGLPGADIESPGTFGKFTSTYSPLFGQNARQVDFMLRLTF